MTHHQNFSSSRRGVAIAAAVLASIASISSGAAAAGSAGAPQDAFARVGASLPVADFGVAAGGEAQASTAMASSTASRASGFASALAGEAVAFAGAATSSATHAQYQVQAQGGMRYLAEAPRARSVVFNDPFASDSEVAARDRATSPARDRLGAIRVLVDNERQEVLAVNAAVADDVGSRWDVGAERARRVFEATVESLSANQLVATEVTSLDTVRAHRLMQGEQAAGQAPVTRVKEYFFEMPATVGGIEVFGAGTTVAVHRSGQLASIRAVGPAVGLSPSRETVTRVVPTESLGKRAAAEHPGATVVPLGLRYPWQATRDAALAARPREAFQVIPTTEVDGQKVKGRAHYVFYSVESERIAPMVWPQPNPGATGDERK